MKHFFTITTALFAFSLFAFCSGGALAEEEFTSGIWGQGFQTDAEQDSISGLPGYEYDTTGFIFGYDKVLGDKLVLGVNAGYHETDVDGDAGDISDINTFLIGAYGSYNFYPYYADFGLMFARGDIDSKRNQNLITSSTNSNNYSLFMEFGKEIPITDIVNFIPVAGFTANYVSIDGYTEEGATGQEMLVEESDNFFFTSELGLKSNITLSQNSYLKLSGLWAHEFSDDLHSAAKGRFVGTSDVIMMQGLDVGRDRGVFGIGLNFKPVKDIVLDIDYNFEVGEEFNAHTGTFTLKKLF
ncbi:MAG: autotransporter outer membrane beta-barrel domain-containing protein [Deltaproteobacteria bacterium]|nr:autotransporter outer membrane beta-barrel domain-containing protein [Deltaproteobacteria bacterium]